MSLTHDWPGAWPADDLEYIGCCPVCGATGRSLIFDDLTDVNQRCAPGRWKLWKCSGCGCGYLDPRPTERSIVRAYATYPTHRVIETNDDRRRGLARLAAIARNSYLNRRYGTRRTPGHPWAWLLMYLLPPPLRLEWDHYMRHLPRATAGRNRLLDIGCGNGDFLLRAEEVGWSAYGLEVDPAAADTARTRGAKVYTGTLGTAPFEDASFDVVTANQVIEHVHDPTAFLRACWRLVRPGGLLWIGTPNLDAPMAERFGTYWQMLEVPRHLTLFNQSSLMHAFRRAEIGTSRCVRRGWCIAWVMQDSENIARGAMANTVERVRLGLAVRGAWSEMGAWLSIRRGVELTAIAHKPR